MRYFRDAIKRWLNRLIVSGIQCAIKDSVVRYSIEEILREDSHDIKLGLQKLANYQTCCWLEENIPLHSVYDDRYDLLRKAIQERIIVDGLILEFGVYKGSTISYIAEMVSPLQVDGFDSFLGLKEPWIFHDPGAFDELKGNLPQVPDNALLHQGYFEESLPVYLENHPVKNVSFVHIDSDLYSSAKYILNTLGDRITSGTIIVFDEFFNYPGWREGEYKAWVEFLGERDHRYEYIGYTWQKTLTHKSGNQVAIRIL